MKVAFKLIDNLNLPFSFLLNQHGFPPSVLLDFDFIQPLSVFSQIRKRPPIEFSQVGKQGLLRRMNQ
jgi:hypothetical protein